MLKRFAAYYKPYKLLFAADMIASMLVALVGIVYPMITRTMLNDLIPNRQYRMIVWYGIGLLIIYAVRAGLNYFIQYYGHIMGVRMQAQMRSDMFTHLEKLPFKYYDTHETGKIMSRMTSDLWDISELAHHGPENLLISTITVIVSFIYLMSINLYLTLIIFACVPFLLVISFSLRKKMRDAFKESRESIAVINSALESSISGIRVTKAFTNSDKEVEKFEEGNKEYVVARNKAYKAMGLFHSGNTFVTDVFNVVILIAGGLFLYAGKIALGDYSAFIVSVGLFISPIMTLIGFMEQYQNGVTGFERFLQIIDAEPEKDAEGAVDAGVLTGNIELKDVTFAYDKRSEWAEDKDKDKDKDKKKKRGKNAEPEEETAEDDNGKTREVLQHVDLSIKKGQTFALVGPSGGGKTTICHLIPRFYEIESGKILLDGKDLSTLTAESVRRSIGIVQQDIYLFNATIRENILYGRLDATDEEVIEAAKRANLNDYIMTMENGYDTIIGERGVRLSGGQKQRLSIARVFLKNPPILILDEATSALDNTTEMLIQKSLDELSKGRTTIVVAHRLSTIKNADEIAVIADGSILERGTHKELLAKNGMYAELYREQFRLDEAEAIGF